MSLSDKNKNDFDLSALKGEDETSVKSVNNQIVALFLSSFDGFKFILVKCQDGVCDEKMVISNLPLQSVFWKVKSTSGLKKLVCIKKNFQDALKHLTESGVKLIFKPANFSSQSETCNFRVLQTFKVVDVVDFEQIITFLSKKAKKIRRRPGREQKPIIFITSKGY